MSFERVPARLWAVLIPVWLGGGAVLVWAAAAFATRAAPGTEVLGVGVLVAAALIAEAFRVPLAGVEFGRVSLGYVFGTAAIVLFGWEAGVLVLASAPTVRLVERRPPGRVAYGIGVLALSGGAGGVATATVTGTGPGELVLRIALASAAQFTVAVTLVALALAVGSSRSLPMILARTVRQLVLPGGLMASAALTLVVLWERQPALSLAVIGPLLAIALYQRSTHREVEALRLALTDPLTGLGNHRHFHERLQRELLVAQDGTRTLSLCVLDVDDFKRVNDRFGHPEGDGVLAELAARLRHGGEAFRLGGDEFAVLLPGYEEAAAREAATAIVERVAAVPFSHRLVVTVSAGVATLAPGAVGRDELIRLADSALYTAKEHGKNQVRSTGESIVELPELRRLAASVERRARYHAASRLAEAVDARDAFDGAHSRRVGELSARVAARLGGEPDQVELARLAGNLHDLGKLAIPEEILRKDGPLSELERRILERHPQTGFRMLASLGVDRVATWVLHHHERWDGSGYPDRLRGEEIPLGARIVFAADAFDAMTSERIYGARLTVDEALAELRRCAGTQFDPRVVEAFAEEFASEYEPVAAALAS